MAAGERVLLPAVRGAEPGTEILADGFSCRTQIAHARTALPATPLSCSPTGWIAAIEVLPGASPTKMAATVPVMRMSLSEAEPAAGLWRVAPLPELVSVLLDAAGPAAGRPRIIAVDGRSGSGKTTLTERLRSAVPGAEVVHTDDIAWSHSRFGWDDLMLEGVLETLHRGSRYTTSHPRGPAMAVLA